MARLFSPTRTALALASAAAFGIYPVRAGETKVTENGTTTVEEETPAKNWIELGIGGVNIGGDDAQFKQ
jgi:hypothetical protein